jgi:hypothetical protein
MATKSAEPKSDLYQDNSNIKWIALAFSVLISIGSIYYTKILVDQLKEREKQQVILFAKAIEYTANSNESSLEEVNFIAQEILFHLVQRWPPACVSTDSSPRQGPGAEPNSGHDNY